MPRHTKRVFAEIQQSPQRTVIWSSLTACGLLLLFLPEFIHYESNLIYMSSYVVAALMTMTALFGYRGTKEEWVLLLPLILILVIGLAGSSADQYTYYKDLWYFSKPIFYIGAGLFLQRSGLRTDSFLSVILYLGLGLSLVHLSFFARMPQLLAEPVDAIRKVAGGGNLLVIFALAYISGRARFLQIRNPLRIPRWALLVVLYASLLLAFSRTCIAVYLITIVLLERLYSLRCVVKRTNAIVLACGFFAVFFLCFGAHMGELKQKVLNSFNEITIHNRYDTQSDIATQWRGYEADLAIEELKQGTFFNRVLGYGFGKTVFIGWHDFPGYGILDIPILHNGFLSIVLKTGCAGLLLYLGFFWNAMRIIHRSNEPYSDTARFLRGMLMSSLFATLVITGYYNKSELNSTCIMTGFFLSGLLRQGRPVT